MRRLDPTGRSDADRDLLPYDGPRSRYILATLQRTGSTLLTDTLWDTGVAGAPMEYFNPGSLVDLFQRLHGAGPWERLQRWRRRRERAPVYIGETGWSERKVRRYVCLVERARTGSNGFFGVKIHFSQARRAFFGKGLDLAAFFPGARYVYITREDQIRQAVSWVRARQSGVWDQRSPRVELAPPSYDFEAIRKRLEVIRSGEAGWEAWFAKSGIEPLRIRHEQLMAEFEPTVRRVLRHIGVEEADTVPVPEPVWRPLSGPERDLWTKRFRDEIEQS